MRTLMRYFLVILLIGLTLVSCRDNDLFGNGEGVLSLNISVKSGLPSVSVGTRATLTDEELLQKCKVYIRNSEGLVRKYATIDEMPNQIQLVPNIYRAEVTAGDSVAASFTDSYFKGIKEFTIAARKAVSETVICGIRNTVVNLNLSDELRTAFSSYTITISNRMGKLEYTADNIDKLGYFMLLDDENQLRWSFTATVKGTENRVLKSGTINLVKKATKYDLTFENPSPEVGGAMISVSVIETALVSDLNIELMARPLIKVIENTNIYDLDNPIYRVQNDKSTPIVVRMVASVPFTELQISSTDFARLGIDKFSSFDLMGLTTTQIRELSDLGFLIEFNTDTTKVQFTFKENLREKMTASIDPDENTFKFDINVKDKNAKTRSKTLTVIATDALVATEDIPSQDVIWATKTTLYGSLVAETNNIVFKYRVKDSGDTWTSTGQVTLDGKTFTCAVEGLLPGTTYEYQAVANESVLAKEIKTFTTESAVQLENSSFEDWHQSGKILYIYNNGGKMFWDSGNTGSSTLSKNVTTNDGSIKHSGNYSAKLQSQFVGVIGIGAFAAGNIYIGKFLKVDGTDGILRFGRPFVSRPSALKLYYKYVSGTIDYSDHADAPKGSKDIGTIYIALGDWPHSSYGDESGIPVLVETKKRPAGLFDPNSSNVIAYGAVDLKESTEGDDMIELTIPIIYRSTRKPTDIVVVGSASKYGDYFTGSTGSTLWLDDVELIYSDDIKFE